MSDTITRIVYGCSDCGVLRYKPHRFTCRFYGSGEPLNTKWNGISSDCIYGPSIEQCRAYRGPVDPVVRGEVNGRRFIAPLTSGTQIRKAIKEFSKSTPIMMEMTE